MAFTERYVRSDAAGGGDGTTDTNSGANGAFTLAEAITHSTTNTGVRYNVRAGTYANTTTSRTFSGAGTATSPNYWRGFNSAIGDLATDWSTAPPLITFTTGQMTISGAHQVFSNLSITSQATASNGALNVTGGVWLDRIRVENTAANSASRAMTLNSGTHNRVTRCWFKATSTADAVVCHAIASLNHAVFASNYCTGGIVSYKSINSVTATMILLNNHFISPTTYCIHFTSAVTAYGVVAVGNSLYGAGAATDGMRFDTVPTVVSLLANNIISNFTGYGINQTTGAATSLFARLANDFYSCTSGNENGFDYHPNFAYPGTESSSPFTNAGGGDFSLVTGALAIAGGSPGQFENTSLIGYMDCGAQQKQATAGASGGFIIGG